MILYSALAWVFQTCMGYLCRDVPTATHRALNAMIQPFED